MALHVCRYYKVNALKYKNDFNKQNNILLPILNILTLTSQICCFISTAQLVMAARITGYH